MLRYGTWNYGKDKLNIDENLVNQLKQNFLHSPFAPVTRGHIDQEEMEKNPYLIVSKNIKGLEIKDDGLYASMELDDQDLEKYNDVSVSIEPNYENHENGKDMGWILKHVALVTNPFIKGLKPFTELQESHNILINLSEIKDMDDKTTKDIEAKDSIS